MIIKRMKKRLMKKTTDNCFSPYRDKIYKGDELREIAFPLGGLGTGCISLSGKGELVDWEIFNRPNKNYRPRHSFFSVWAKKEGDDPVFRILESQISPAHSRHLTREDACGAIPWFGFNPGLPRMEKAEFKSRFPFANIAFHDKKMPLKISLEAFNPFIPLNVKDSALPLIVFFVTLKNPGKKKVRATLALCLENINGYIVHPSAENPPSGKCVNRFRKTSDLNGISLASEKFPSDSPRFGNMAAGTTWKKTTWQVPWFRGGWWDGLQHFCNTFAKTGRFDNNEDSSPSGENATDVVSLGLQAEVAPGKEVRLPVILSWYNPLFELYWQPPACDKCSRAKWKNYYATIFKDSWEVMEYTFQNLDRLLGESRTFSESLYRSTIPSCVIESAANNLSTLKTPTCVLLEDGSFYGFEGCCEKWGCCEGSCTHVWNYAQAIPLLFPSLERGLRENELKHCVREDGHMQFRMPLPLGAPAKHDFHAAVDGQLGSVLKVYREYLFCGDKMWSSVKKILEYAWKEWDADKDGMIDGMHHNTYDIEFHSAEPLANSFYLAALKAATKMAKILGDDEKTREYEALFQSGSKKMDKILFNGEYYFQKIKDVDQYKYQFGKGCLSDQMIGQWYADMLDLGDLTDPTHIEKAYKSIFKYNWKKSFADFVNTQRVYVMNDEKGLLLCTWPKGGRPRFPFPYSDEVWYGIEYQVACGLIYRGMVDEALSIVEAMRERHGGNNRNPWNEPECGNHYARSLASFGLVPALSGFHYSAGEKLIQFSPVLNQKDFECFFAACGAWGIFTQKRIKNGKCKIRIIPKYGSMDLKEMVLPDFKEVSDWQILQGDNKIEGAIKCTKTDTIITLSETTRIDENAPLIMIAKKKP
jgi:non-lysosomal glucosylceramidase